MFVDILGYEGIYRISPQGEIFSLYQNRLLKGWIQSIGYKAVSLYKNGKATKFHLHTLLAQAFIPNPLKLPEVNHKDGTKQNNALSNLEWVTGSQNIRHAFASGLTSKSACVDYSKVPALLAEVISGAVLRDICDREGIEEASTLRKLLLREAKRTGLELEFMQGTCNARKSIVLRRSHKVIKKDAAGNVCEVFNSINEASRSIFKNPASIWKAVKSQKMYQGYYWEKQIA